MNQANATNATGDQLYENAVKTYNIWYKFIDRDNHTTQAYHLFVKAKNKYIMEKNNKQIIACYEWMVKCLNEITNNLYVDDIGNIYDEYAFFLFQHGEKDKAIALFNHAIDIYLDNGYFSKIIKIKELLAEHYKKQDDYEIAIKMYKELKELYNLQTTTKYYTNYRLDRILFELYIKTDNFVDASQIYNISNMGDEVNKFKYEEIITSAILCFICIDILLAKSKLEDFTNRVPAFIFKEQYSFLMNVIECVENDDAEPLDIINKKKLDPVDQLLIDKIISGINDNPSYL